MVGLVVGGLILVLLMLYAADRVLKARAHLRRLRKMRDRLAAASARADAEQEKRQASAQASAALTAVLPAIQRPPLSLPGVPHSEARRTAAGECTGPQERRSAHPGRRASQTGDHPARPAGRTGR